MRSAFHGKRIVILGLARQGLALARFFTAAGAQVTVSDAAPAEKLAAELDKLDGCRCSSSWAATR